MLLENIWDGSLAEFDNFSDTVALVDEKLRIPGSYDCQLGRSIIEKTVLSYRMYIMKWLVFLHLACMLVQKMKRLTRLYKCSMDIHLRTRFLGF
jgi:hypothetical protein